MGTFTAQCKRNYFTQSSLLFGDNSQEVMLGWSFTQNVLKDMSMNAISTRSRRTFSPAVTHVGQKSAMEFLSAARP